MSATYSAREERANSWTHGVGIPLSVAGLVGVVVAAARHGDGWQITSTAIFGVTLVLLYTTSTLYHAMRQERTKYLLRKFDHAAIFLLIAGTYTPFVLVSLRGPWGWSLFGVVWGLAVAGVILKFWFAGRFRVVSTLLYLGMGWLVLIALKPLLAALPPAGFAWLVAGGASYSLGTVFYLWKRLPYHHAVWHLWVLAGSFCHWVAVFGYVARTA
ncbi:PAQR family membrane homeostasis protein TrhA [Synoicihabitans lomoniglobus]|uniref:Hemolysin III family protein n=1 Tax=Synoicihabitans lomoniglobus TaxID=2909285 RepID=A0AAF0CPG4_9BACT|nr:hemolysin III family protein [Opitutaceae bacterium LMO-M01]WED64609.1 hemolysin III family protein [Opitutaceae bacterium LMO-M01]